MADNNKTVISDDQASLFSDRENKWKSDYYTLQDKYRIQKRVIKDQKQELTALHLQVKVDLPEKMKTMWKVIYDTQKENQDLLKEKLQINHDKMELMSEVERLKLQLHQLKYPKVEVTDEFNV